MEKEALIEGNTATIEMRVKIPLHYYEFLKYLNNAHGIDIHSRMAKDAADGIIMDVNNLHGALHEALGEADAIINPELLICSRSFKMKPSEPEQQPEDRQP